MSFPTFEYEEALWSQRKFIVAGCDEVGKGCFAGPVVAGGVIFPHNLTITLSKKLIINDSKKIDCTSKN